MIANQKMVLEFMEKYGLAIDRDWNTRFVRARLIVEEVGELFIAVQENNREQIIDACADLEYVTCGAALLYDIEVGNPIPMVGHDSFDLSQRAVKGVSHLVTGIFQDYEWIVYEGLFDVRTAVYSIAEYNSFNLNEALRRVHASNMTKGQDTGHGKLLKGPGWVPPDFTGL